MLYLEEFGSQVWSAFGQPPFLVGSALMGKKWRDVDVRLIMDDEEFKMEGYGDVKTYPHLWLYHSGKWAAVCMAFSALGAKLTGLPIDFQIQPMSVANARWGLPEHHRQAIGCVELRYGKPVESKS